MNSYNVFYFGEWLCTTDADSEEDAKTNVILKARSANLNLKGEHLMVKPLPNLFAL